MQPRCRAAKWLHKVLKHSWNWTAANLEQRWAANFSIQSPTDIPMHFWSGSEANYDLHQRGGAGMITVGTNWANAVEILQETSKIKHFKLDFLHEGHRPRKKQLGIKWQVHFEHFWEHVKIARVLCKLGHRNLREYVLWLWLSCGLELSVWLHGFTLRIAGWELREQFEWCLSQHRVVHRTFSAAFSRVSV